MKTEIKNFKMLVDTCKVSVKIDNIKNYGSFNDSFRFVKRGTVNDKIKDDGLYKNAIINANNYSGIYVPIHSKSEFIEVMSKISNEMGIIEVSKIELNRIDIAIDSEMNFKNNFKRILFIFELITVKEGCKENNRWYTTNLNTLNNNTIFMIKRSMEICFYDKAEESKNKHYANTRFEFRFKKIKDNNYEKHILKIKELIQNIDKSIIEVEEKMTKNIIELWKKDKKEVKSFSEFVRKNSDFFYTTKILENVYKNAGLKGGYNNWLKKFREKNEMIFCTKNDITMFKREVKKALKDYIKK